MEVKVYLNLAARSNGKPVFDRMVSCPDAFDIKSFCNNMKSIFGECVIEFLVV